MPRKKREFVENGFYHVMTRGNDKRKIFFKDEDYLYFISLLLRYLKKYSIKIYNFVLMPNHFHLLISALEKSGFSNFMKCVNLSYGTYFRKHYKSVGYLYQGRFKSIIVENDFYLLECARYIEYNPVKAGLIDRVENYKWSSINYYMNNEMSELITENPVFQEFKTIDRDETIKNYLDFVNKGEKERRSEERLFKEKVYGSKRLKNKLSLIGITEKWSHSGRPKKIIGKRENVEEK